MRRRFRFKEIKTRRSRYFDKSFVRRRVNNKQNIWMMLTRGTPWLSVEPVPLFTHECRPVRRSNTILKFVDNIRVIGLITTMRKLTEGYSTWSHDALKLTWCSSLWWEGEKEAHITPATWMGWLSSVSQVSSFWGPTSWRVCSKPPTSPAWSKSSPVVLLPEDAEEEPPELLPLCDWVPQQNLSWSGMEAAQSLNARHYSRRWKLQTHQRNSIYSHWWHQQDILTASSWQQSNPHLLPLDGETIWGLYLLATNQPQYFPESTHAKWKTINIDVISKPTITLDLKSPGQA